MTRRLLLVAGGVFAAIAVLAVWSPSQTSAFTPQISAICRIVDGTAFIDWEASANNRTGNYDVIAHLNNYSSSELVDSGVFVNPDDSAAGTYEVPAGTIQIDMQVIVDGEFASTTGRIWIQDTQNNASDCTDTPDPPDPLDGWMTGGGSVFTIDGARVTRGFVINCSAGANPGDSIEVNWPGGNKFHTSGDLTTRLCIDDPAVVPDPPPNTGFDTFIGVGPGKLNNVDGARIEFVFVDAGEPGDMDTASIQIYDENGVLVLDVSGFVDRGNLQAHTK